MQQRRVRLGDILDDYCPRERRITNHAVVAMIDDTVKQTRCTTCDADHEYKEARVPAPRRRKAGALGTGELAARPRPVAAPALPVEDPEEPDVDLEPLETPGVDDTPVLTAGSADVGADEHTTAEGDAADETPAEDRDEWPVHRPLIRATLPRPEGQLPERKTPDFTFRPAGGRFDRNGKRQGGGGHRPVRQAHGQPTGQGRFGGRSGSGQGRQGGGQAQAQRHGNRQGPAGGGRPGQGRGPRPGGSGRKRGR
jgi:hypothetical protein